MWLYENRNDFMIPEDSVGFIYEIRRTNLIESIVEPYLYIGKKQLFGKGKGNKGQESNWREYWGSSNYLWDDIKKYGEQDFERHILMFCYSYSELNWEELRMQIELGTLAYNERAPMEKKYYNFNVIQKLYKDRYFENTDTERVEAYLDEDFQRDYPLYLTNGKENIVIEYGLYDIKECLRYYPSYRIGTTPNIRLDGIKFAHLPCYEYKYKASADGSLLESFEGYDIVSNAVAQFFGTTEECNDQLQADGWKRGPLQLELEDVEKVIMATNYNTLQTENVVESVFKEGPYVKFGTKPIEVKEGKEVIFRGYAKKFIIESGYDIKESWITRVLKKSRIGSWQDLTPTYTKKAREINPDLLVKRTNKIKST